MKELKNKIDRLNTINAVLVFSVAITFCIVISVASLYQILYYSIFIVIFLVSVVIPIEKKICRLSREYYKEIRKQLGDTITVKTSHVDDKLVEYYFNEREKEEKD